MMTVIWEVLPADSILAGDRSVTVWLLLILLAAVIGAYLWGLNRREKKGHADQLTARYKSLDESGLAEIPDDRLVDAVAANVIAKLDPRRPDAYHLVPTLSQGRCSVYCVWLVCHECAQEGLAGFYAGPSAVFAELAADGLELVGAVECAAAVRAAMREGADLSALSASFDDAAKRELPLEKCVAYIRDNPGEFVDAPSDSHTSP